MAVPSRRQSGRRREKRSRRLRGRVPGTGACRRWRWIKPLLAVVGVTAVCQSRDDDAFVEGYGLMPAEALEALAHFAHDYKRILQRNADQLSICIGIRGWIPPVGWVVRGAKMTVCSVANVVCPVENAETDRSEAMQTPVETSHC